MVDWEAEHATLVADSALKHKLHLGIVSIS